MRPLLSGGTATYLSLGERPVCGVVTATTAPLSARRTSSRARARSIRRGTDRFRWAVPANGSAKGKTGGIGSFLLQRAAAGRELKTVRAAGAARIILMI